MNYFLNVTLPKNKANCSIRLKKSIKHIIVQVMDKCEDDHENDT